MSTDPSTVGTSPGPVNSRAQEITEPADAPPSSMAAGASDTSAMQAQVARAGTWGISGRIILLLANLGATPFTIRLLGPSAYGLWALIQSLLTWASLAEGGMATATTKYGAERYAAGDDAGEARIVWSGLCFALIALSSVALTLSLGAHFLLGLLHVHGNLVDAGALALRLACATFVLSSLVGTVNTAQQVRLRWKWFTLLSVCSNLIGAVGVPLAIYLLSGGVVTAAAVGLVAAFIYMVGMSWDALRLQPALRRPSIDRATLRKLISYGGLLTLAGLAAVVLTTAERFFLSANTSTTVVAYYAVAMTIASTVQVLPEQLVSPLMPALTRLEADRKQKEHRTLYGKSLAGLFLVLTPAAIVIVLLARPFLSLWAGPQYGAHSSILLVILIGGVWVNSLAQMPWTYMLSAGKVKTYAILQGVEVAPYLAAAWVFTAKWGAVGAAAAWSARCAVDSIALFIIVLRSAGLPVVPLSARRIRSLLAPALLAIACAGVAALNRGLPVRSAMAAVLVVAYGVVVWQFVLTPKERGGVANLLADMLGLDLRSGQSRPAHARPSNRSSRLR